MLSSPHSSRWQLNPIIVKELRSMMRGGRAFLTITIALILMSLAGLGLYRMTVAATQYSTTPLSPQVGQVLFFGLAFIELLVMAAITPSVTAGAISGERERETYEMLLATPLHPASILWGKLVSAMGYVFLMFFAAIPLSSIVFLFGGVSPRDMFKTLLVLLVVMVLFGVTGLFMSALFGRSGRATAMAYLAILILILGPILITIGAGVMVQGDPPRWPLMFSPVSALASAMSPSVDPNSISGLFWMLGSPLSWIMGSAPVSYDSIPRPVYHYSIPIFLGISFVLYLIASHLVRASRRWHIEWAEIVVIVVVLVGLVGSAGLAYAATTNRYENVIIQTEPTPRPEIFETPIPETGNPILVPEVTEPEMSVPEQKPFMETAIPRPKP